VVDLAKIHKLKNSLQHYGFTRAMKRWASVTKRQSRNAGHSCTAAVAVASKIKLVKWAIYESGKAVRFRAPPQHPWTMIFFCSPHNYKALRNGIDYVRPPVRQRLRLCRCDDFVAFRCYDSVAERYGFAVS
jgi:hypothetical protein